MNRRNLICTSVASLVCGIAARLGLFSEPAVGGPLDEREPSYGETSAEPETPVEGGGEPAENTHPVLRVTSTRLRTTIPRFVGTAEYHLSHGVTDAGRPFLEASLSLFDSLGRSEASFTLDPPMPFGPSVHPDARCFHYTPLLAKIDGRHLCLYQFTYTFFTEE